MKNLALALMLAGTGFLVWKDAALRIDLEAARQEAARAWATVAVASERIQLADDKAAALDHLSHSLNEKLAGRSK